MGKPIHLLAIDDEEAQTLLIKLNLQNDKLYDSQATTSSVKEESKLARLHRPDLILLDIIMPVCLARK